MKALLLVTYLFYLNVRAQNAIGGDNVTSNDYAEVRLLLNQFYQIAAQKYNSFHDYNPKKVSNMLRRIPTDDGTEASVNRKEGVVGDLFENDILLTLAQAKALLKETGKSRDARQAVRDTHHTWTKMPISYHFGVFDVKWQKLIRSALHHIETETCVRFQENGHDPDHILFTRASGCWSNVGRVGGRQLISIGFGCDALGIVAHEMLHVLGLWHEQSRSDRDTYIWIDYVNIYPGTQGNFEKRTALNSDNMGQPYDLGSVMHYGSKAFTTSFDRYTIETRDRQYQHTIGQRKGISFKDAKMINLRYCKGFCRHQIYCYNGGYINPNNCYQCKCPPGFGGNDCTSVQKSETPNCGGELVAKYDHQIINSTGLGTTAHCVWRIRSIARVLVYIDQLELPCKQEACTSFLELKYKADMVATGPRLCCNPPRMPIVSDNGTFIIIYVANAKVNDYRRRGFKLRYKLYEQGAPSTQYLSSTTPTLSTVPSTTATTRTIITPTTIAGPVWSEWGQWSPCSTSCGGCGLRRRIRACYGGNRQCPGSFHNEENCGEKRCPIGKGYGCRGRLVMPCDLLHRLQFTADKGAHVASHNKNMFATSLKYKKRYNGLAFSGEQICEKYFDYRCSMSMLTLYMGWKTVNGWLDFDGRGCCSGYHFNGTACIPD